MKPLYIKKNGQVEKVTGAFAMPATYPAERVAYDNTTSGLSADDAQGAIDEIVSDLDDKVDKVAGKGLSTNDFTNEDKALIGQTLGNNTVLTTDKTPFLTRQTLNPTGFSGYVREKLVGASYAWNQLVQNGNFADTSGWTATNTTFTVSGNVATMARVSTSGGSYIRRTVSKIAGHKYFFSITAKSNSSNGHNILVRWYKSGSSGSQIDLVPSTPLSSSYQTFKGIIATDSADADGDIIVYNVSNDTDSNNIKDFYVSDLTLAFGSTIADHLYNLSNNGGITKLRDMGFPIDQYTPYGYGLYSVKTSGKRITINSFTGLEQKTRAADGTKTDLSIRCISKDFYDLKAGKTYVLFAKTSDVGKTLRCSWQTWANKNNSGNTRTYDTGWLTDFPIVITPTNDVIWTCTFSYSDESEIDKNHITVSFGDTITFSLGNDELRGKFDLVNGEIVASGDVKESNGEITRNWLLFNLGSYNWTLQTAGSGVFYSDVINALKAPASGWNTKIITAKYVTDQTQSDKFCFGIASGGRIFIKDTAYSDGATLKTSLADIYAVAELARPTTVQSTPFADPMSMVGATTEEYIDDRTIPCPVGAERQYMGQSEDVVEIPSSPQSDGKRVLTSYVSGGKQQFIWDENNMPFIPVVGNLISNTFSALFYPANGATSFKLKVTPKGSTNTSISCIIFSRYTVTAVTVAANSSNKIVQNQSAINMLVYGQSGSITLDFDTNNDYALIIGNSIYDSWCVIGFIRGENNTFVFETIV